MSGRLARKRDEVHTYPRIPGIPVPPRLAIDMGGGEGLSALLQRKVLTTRIWGA